MRASLEQYSTDDFSSSFLFDPSKINNDTQHKPNSAIQVLIDEVNLGLELYPGKGEMFDEEETRQKGVDIEKSKAWKKKRGYYLFEDLVELHYNTLEQIMEHHVRLAGQNGVNLKVRVRKHLEGWDFAELATGHDPYPRVATLQALGYGWIEFTRSIDAITLFGRGFGDIIRPIEFDGMCPRWRSLPTQKYYLAASVSDLKNIVKKFSESRADPPRPVHDLLWHCPENPVATCQCQEQGTRKKLLAQFRQHHDPVQVFYPRGSRFVLSIRGPGRLKAGGAVIFGHNVGWGYRWRESGKEDLEKIDLTTSSDFLEPQTTIASGGSSSELSDHETDVSTASRSTQSYDSTTNTTVYSKSSALSPQVPPIHVEATIDMEPPLVPPPAQQTIQSLRPSKTLRREHRHL